MSCKSGGMPTGAKLKKQVIPFGVSGFATWLIQVVEVKNKYGSDFAVEFVNESKNRFEMTESEYNYALSLAQREAT